MNDSVQKQVLRLDWEKAEPLHALICLPPVLAALLVGVYYGYPGTAVLIAGGAMCVGFGSFQPPLFWRWGPMLAAMLGISISGSVGVLASAHTWLFTAVVVLWAFVYGLLSAAGPVASWVGLQCCVYLVISAAAARMLVLPEALLRISFLRGSGLLAGGALQFLWILFMWNWIPRAPSTYTDPQWTRQHLRASRLLDAFRGRGTAYWFAVQMALTALMAMLVFEHMQFNNSYWIPMTALLIPREGFYETTVRGVLRLAGTVLGAVVCTLVTVVIHPAGEVLSVLVVLFLFLCYWLQRVNYGVFAIGLTGYIVFILAIVRYPERMTITHRISATMIGGAIALVVHYLFQLRNEDHTEATL